MNKSKMTNEEGMAALYTLHGLEISLEIGLEKIRELRKRFEASNSAPEPVVDIQADPLVLKDPSGITLVSASYTRKDPEQEAPGTSGPTTVSAPVKVKGKRRARCADCSELHWNGHNGLCDGCVAKK